MKRIKTTVGDKDKERPLARIATRGVVKFFNVVQKQQHDLESTIKKVGPYERKIDKVYNSLDKKSFLERLKESNKEHFSSDEDNNNLNHEKVETNKPSWNVLRKDYVMDNSKKMKWDKPSDDNDE